MKKTIGCNCGNTIEISLSKCPHCGIVVQDVIRTQTALKAAAVRAKREKAENAKSFVKTLVAILIIIFVGVPAFYVGVAFIVTRFTNNPPRAVNKPSVTHLIGTKYIYPKSIEIISQYGSPETLSGTNNNRWVAYFPKGNFTIITDKKSNVIMKVLNGKRPIQY